MEEARRKQYHLYSGLSFQFLRIKPFTRIRLLSIRNFNLNSNMLAVSDFMVEDEAATELESIFANMPVQNEGAKPGNGG